MPLRLRTGLGLILFALALGPVAAAQQGGLGLGYEDLLNQPAGQPAQEPALEEAAGQPAPVRPGSWTSVPIRFVCSPGFYVWHNSIKVALGKPVAGISVSGLDLPEAKEKYDGVINRTVAYLDGTFSIAAAIDVSGEVAAGDYDLPLTVRYTLCGPDLCRFPKADLTVKLIVAQDAALPAGPKPGQAGAVAPGAAPPIPVAADDPFAGHSPVVVVLVAFLLGLGLTLTPCVYPLIPVTIGVVGATSGEGRMGALGRSLIYVLGISITYSAVGVAAAATGGLFGQIAHHPAVYIALAVIFVLLAGGMFDVYTIDLSSQRLHRAQAALRGRAGLAGVLVIGMLSGAAATACIAPVIIAALGYVATSGSLLMGWAIFFAMAWGMGAPLVLVGTFAGLAQSLPRSGQWMVTIKHVLGFILLACAVWFVMKSAVLPEPWPQMLLGGFLLVSSVFAGAFDSLGSDSGWRPRARKAVGLLLLAGAIAAFMQPVLTAAPIAGGLSMPRQGVQWLESEDEALARAQSEGKPVLLDFWSENCAPCIRMFKTTYVDPRVVAESRRFVCAKIDVGALTESGRDHLRDAYGLRGVPTTVFVGTDGSTRILTSEIDADEMLELMRSTP
jgi:thiol:disulfide interchange protein DsbD